MILPSESVHRRPDGPASIPTRSTPRAMRLREAIGAALADDAGRGAWRRPRRATICRPRPRASRRLRGVALGCSRRPTRRAARRWPRRSIDAADNMTDRQGALASWPALDAPERAGGARRFLRALSRRSAGHRQMVRAAGRGAARRHARRGRGAAPRIPTSRIAQPQPPARAGRQLRGQPVGVPPRRRARGYRLLADMILAVDEFNPQVAARLVPPLGRWRRFEAPYRRLMRGRARTDRGGAGAEQGCVRAGVEDARVRPSSTHQVRVYPTLPGQHDERNHAIRRRLGRLGLSFRRSSSRLARDLVGGVVERRADGRGGAVGGHAGFEAAGFDAGAAGGWPARRRSAR